ncbi:MAG: hypothetical protein PVI33_01470 [Candidatus Omnitrophota bacterium]|jgi:hypothetical protein
MKSQIATILTLAIAAIFLFILITINIGKVSQKKTVIDNACDGAGLLLASSLSSVGTALKQSLELFGGATERCKWNMAMIVGIAIIIAGVIGAIFTAGTSSLLVAIGIGALSVGVGAYSIYSGVQASYVDPGLLKEMEAKFQNMTAEQRLTEQTIQYALFATIDDPAWVPDKFDSDRDGVKMTPSGGGPLDKIPQFSHWYFQRLNDLPRVGQPITNFYRYLFPVPNAGPGVMGGQFEILEVADTWDAQQANLLVNADWIRWGGTNWGIREWLAQVFKPFIVELWGYGYGVEFAIDYEDDITYLNKDDPDDRDHEHDELGQLYRDIVSFEDWAKGIYSMSKDELIVSYEQWIGQLDNLIPEDASNEDEGADWYDRMGLWLDNIRGWISLLETRHNQVLDCLRNRCCRNRYSCCSGDSSTGPCCRRVCCRWCTACDEYDCWTYCCGTCCITWMGCCGQWRCCCQQCGATCPPHGWSFNPADPVQDCNVPLLGPAPGGPAMRNCCDSACNLQAGSRISCNQTRIEPYINVLRNFEVSITALRQNMHNLANQVAVMKSYPWVHEAIYVWKDRVLDELGQAVPGKETPAHMVYVRLNMDVGDEFKFPYITTKRRNWGFRICQVVEDAEGKFEIEVARYDEDTAKVGPLRNLWRLKFRQQPGGGEDARVTLLHNVADRYYNRLNLGNACTLNQLITPAERQQLTSLAWERGIASKARFNYGPGDTFRPGVDGTARERNRQIFIDEKIR